MRTGGGKEISCCQSGSGWAWQPHKNPFRLGPMQLATLQSGSALPAFFLFAERLVPHSWCSQLSFHLEEVWLGSRFSAILLFDQWMGTRFCAQWTSLVRFPVYLLEGWIQTATTDVIASYCLTSRFDTGNALVPLYYLIYNSKGKRDLESFNLISTKMTDVMNHFDKYLIYKILSVLDLCRNTLIIIVILLDTIFIRSASYLWWN